MYGVDRGDYSSDSFLLRIEMNDASRIKAI
jgi:hypothetical protein